MFLQISEQLKSLSTTPSMSSKRIKRSVLSHKVFLNTSSLWPLSDASCVCVCVYIYTFRLSAGALYILWLHIGQGPGGPQVHRAVHSALQGLIAAYVDGRGGHSRAVVTSVSTTGKAELGRPGERGQEVFLKTNM